MKHLHIQGIGGASGDMILAALLDLGAPADELRALLARLPIGPVELATSPAGSHGLHGLRLEVRFPGSSPHSGHAHAHPPHDSGTHHGHAHSHDGDSEPAHAHDSGPAHEHRAFREIRVLLEHGDLPAGVRDRSLCVFARLAEAEGRVHGIPAEAVRFHEVGAVDSIVDIVGACWALDALEVRRVSFDPLPLGSGTVRCAHGVYPVPAPAVVELLRGLPIAGSGEEGEMVTPTGAALLAEWRTDPECPPGRIERAGLGFGRRSWPNRPNVLRATILETGGAPGEGQDEVLQLETDLDDATPEIVGALAGQLLAAGAADVTTHPLFMKKQRPGVRLSVLCVPALRETMLDLVFRESGTLGIRESRVRRTVLERREETVATPYGPVRVKIGTWRGREVVRKPEFDDCVRLAGAAGQPVSVVRAAAVRAADRGGAEH
jgi:hypothetical protein